MNWNKWIRQFHRWVAIVFTLTVIANFVALAQSGGAMPPPWITYSPLLPLALLMLTGLYMFVLPYAAKWRKPSQQDAPPMALAKNPPPHGKLPAGTVP